MTRLPTDTTIRRLPVVGGPIAGTARAAKGLSFSRKDWVGEYRRTTACWQWTPPPGRENPATEVINVTGLVHHPSTAVIANNAETMVRRMRADGVQVRRWATVLAARGLPSSVTGNGARSSDQTTSTERAAGVAGQETDHLTPPDAEWVNVDADLAHLHRQWWTTTTQLLRLYDRILSHAPDDDPIPAGTGSCTRCTKFCRPDEDHPENRIRSGFCPACYQQFIRLGRPDRGEYIRSYKNEAKA